MINTIITKSSKMDFSTQCVHVYTWAYMLWLCPWKACVCRVGCACKDGPCFLRTKISKREWFNVHWLKVEPKQSTLFFKTFISFSIVEDKVEHAIGVQEVEATLAWHTWESISIFKDSFFFKTKSNSFVIESILFSKQDYL